VRRPKPRTSWVSVPAWAGRDEAPREGPLGLLMHRTRSEGAALRAGVARHDALRRISRPRRHQADKTTRGGESIGVAWPGPLDIGRKEAPSPSGGPPNHAVARTSRGPPRRQTTPSTGCGQRHPARSRSGAGAAGAASQRVPRWSASSIRNAEARRGLAAITRRSRSLDRAADKIDQNRIIERLDQGPSPAPDAAAVRSRPCRCTPGTRSCTRSGTPGSRRW
jgi:hypothetical protein